MIKIEIVENIKKNMQQDNKYIKELLKGKIKPDPKMAEKTLIMTPESFSQVFSPEKMKLILKVKREKVSNIYQLAKELNRRYESVYRDIKFLEGFGIIKLKEKDRKMMPYIDEPITIPELAS